MNFKKEFIKKIPHKIKFSAKIIQIYKNWHTGFLDYFGVIKKNKRIIYKLKNGTKYIARAGTNDFGIINEVYVVKEYAPLLKYIKKNSTVIDIGAQIGVFSIFAAKKKRGIKVYSYEPFPKNFDMLNENIKLNKLKEKIFPFKLGISDKKREKEFWISKENTGGHGFYTKGEEKIKIKTIPLKEVFIKNKIKICDFLKMDCEGAEYEIIYNTPDKYLEKIKSITMEYHENGDILKLKKFLKNKGFKVFLAEVGEGMLYAENKKFM